MYFYEINQLIILFLLKYINKQFPEYCKECINFSFQIK